MRLALNTRVVVPALLPAMISAHCCRSSCVVAAFSPVPKYTNNTGWGVAVFRPVPKYANDTGQGVAIFSPVPKHANNTGQGIAIFRPVPKHANNTGRGIAGFSPVTKRTNKTGLGNEPSQRFHFIGNSKGVRAWGPGRKTSYTAGTVKRRQQPQHHDDGPRLLTRDSLTHTKATFADTQFAPAEQGRVC